MKYFNCLTPKNSSDFTYSFKDLNEVPSNELKPGYSSDALTCFSSQVYGKKQSFFGTASTFTKLESPDGDTDDQIFDGEPTSRHSLDIFGERGGPRLSIYRADDPMPSDRNQIDSLSVYKQPKETIITKLASVCTRQEKFVCVKKYGSHKVSNHRTKDPNNQYNRKRKKKRFTYESTQ